MALCMMPVSVQCIGAFATADSLAKLEEDMTAFDGKLSVAEPDDTREQAKLRRDYIDSVKANLKLQLDSLYVLDEKSGKKTNIIDFERERAARAGEKKEKK